MLIEEELTDKIIGAAIEVHRQLGPGLLESVYQACLAQEFKLRGISYQREQPLPVKYKGIDVDCGFQLDFIVEDKVVVELKAVEQVHKVHVAQLLTYLKLTGCQVGFLINFNVPILKQGITRRVF